MTNTRITEDPRIDPRLKAFLGMMPAMSPKDVESREALLASIQTEEAAAAREAMQGFFEMFDSEEVAPSKGLTVTEHVFISVPDGNSIKVRFIRPDATERLPCVYYIHGGGMMSMSCYYGNYRAWGRMIAAHGVAVAMVDFRNALT